MAGMAEDVVKRIENLAIQRLGFEASWRSVADLAAPDSKPFTPGAPLGATSAAGSAFSNQQLVANAAKRSRKIYDTTAINAVDRLSSGLEGLIVPQNEFWHTYKKGGFASLTATDEERRWFEAMRDVTFSERYDTDANWETAIQTALRRVVVFGNASIFVEDTPGTDSIFKYQYVPLPETFYGEDKYGNVDTWFRYYALTARQAVQKFQAKCPAIVAKAAEHPTDKDKNFTFIHAIVPRAEFGSPTRGLINSPVACLHIFADDRSIVEENGYFEFPVGVLRWLPEVGQIYGEGPVMRVLADIQSLNEMAKNELIASQQAVNPALLLPHAGVMNRPNTAPGAINMGGVSPGGQKMIQTLDTGGRLDFASLVTEAKRNGVKESLYLNLFQILIRNPQMSATEALIRANEKGELLGPAGSRIQGAISVINTRELGIMTRRGLWDRGSAYRPPSSMINAKLDTKFSGPLDRLRRAKEAEGTVRTLEIMNPLLQIDPTVADNFEADEMARGLGEILGMPARFVTDQKKRDQIRAQRNARQQAAENMAMAEQGANAVKAGAQAIERLQQGGV